jgi:3-oxoadipate enol-lactonase
MHDFYAPWVPEKDKTTIVMHHGSVNDHQAFNVMVPFLAQRYRVVRFDERGMGESQMAPGTYNPSTERFVRDLLDIADALHLDRFHLYCQGSGGMIGVPFAIAHPGRLLSLTMCQTPYRMNPKLFDSYAMGEKTIGAAILKYGFVGWNERVPGYSVVKSDDPDFVKWVREYRGANPDEVCAGRYDWTFGVDLRDKYKDIKVPTLLINAEGSYQTPTTMGDFLKQQNPNIAIKTVPGDYGQALAFMIPDRLAAIYLEFLDGLEAKARANA